MFIAMNRFRVRRDRRGVREGVAQPRHAAHQGAGFVEFHLLKGPSTRITRSIPRTRCGRARQRSSLDQVGGIPPRPQGRRARTSRSTSTIRSSRVSRSADRAAGRGRGRVGDHRSGAHARIGDRPARYLPTIPVR